MTWFDLKEELGNNEFYKLILGASQHNYNYTILTDMESLSIGDIDEYDLELYQELDEILSAGSAYEIIGFLLMNSIEVKSIGIMRNTKNATRIKLDFSKSAVFCDKSVDELKDTMGFLGFSPDYWIGDEITATYIV